MSSSRPAITEGDQRRIAFRPVGDFFHKRGVGGGIVVGDGERRDHGARIGKGLAAGQAEALRRLVEGDKAEGVLDLADDGEGRLLSGRVQFCAWLPL